MSADLDMQRANYDALDLLIQKANRTPVNMLDSEFYEVYDLAAYVAANDLGYEGAEPAGGGDGFYTYETTGHDLPNVKFSIRYRDQFGSDVLPKDADTAIRHARKAIKEVMS